MPNLHENKQSVDPCLDDEAKAQMSFDKLRHPQIDFRHLWNSCWMRQKDICRTRISSFGRATPVHMSNTQNQVQFSYIWMMRLIQYFGKILVRIFANVERRHRVVEESFRAKYVDHTGAGQSRLFTIQQRNRQSDGVLAF